MAEISQVYNFSFNSSSSFIELMFDDSCKGWTVQPLVEPCRVSIELFTFKNFIIMLIVISR